MARVVPLCHQGHLPVQARPGSGFPVAPHYEVGTVDEDQGSRVVCHFRVQFGRRISASGYHPAMGEEERWNYDGLEYRQLFVWAGQGCQRLA